MDKSKLAKFIDNFVILFSITIITFSILRKYCSLLISLSISIIMGFIIIQIILHFQNKRYSKLKIKNEEKTNIKLYNDELRKMSNNQKNAFFKNLLSKYYVKQYKNAIFLNNNAVIIIYLNQDILTSKEIFETITNDKLLKNTEELIFICNNYETKILNEIKNITSIKIYFYTPIETYALMKKENVYPNTNKENIKNKVKINNIIKSKFVKKQSFEFYKCGLFLFIASFLVPYTKYYIIAGTLFLIIGTICFIFGNKTTYQKEVSKLLL